MAERGNEAEMLTPGWEGGPRTGYTLQRYVPNDHFLSWVPPSSFYHFPVVHSIINPSKNQLIDGIRDF